MGAEQTENLWVVVLCNGTKYLGKIRPVRVGEVPERETLVSDLVDDVIDGEPTLFDEAYEILTHSIPMPSTQGEMHMMRRVTAAPLVQTMHPTPTYLMVSGFQLLADMQPEDRTRYKGLVDAARKTAEEARKV